jgi:Protein kinase domain
MMIQRTLQRWSCCKRRVDSEPLEEEERRGRSGEDVVTAASRDLSIPANRSILRSAPNPRRNRRSTNRNWNIAGENEPPLMITMSPTVLRLSDQSSTQLRQTPTRTLNRPSSEERGLVVASSTPLPGNPQEEIQPRPRKKKYDKAFWLPADVYASLIYLQEEESMYIIGTIVHRNVQGAVYVRESLSLVQRTSSSILHRPNRVYLQTLPMYIAHTTRHFTERTLAGLMYQLATILQTMHSELCRLMHGHLHLNHILMHPQTHQMSLGGFTYCARVHELDDSAPRPFVPPAHRFDWYAFRAPEWDDDESEDGRITTAADIWSFGVIMYTCCTGGIPPFSGRGEALVQAKRHGRLLDIQRISPGISGYLIDLIQQCVHVQPSQRATVHEILRHPWLRRAANVPRRPDPPARGDNVLDTDEEDEDTDLSLAQSLFRDW